MNVLGLDAADVTVYPDSDQANDFARGAQLTGLGLAFHAADSLGYRECSGVQQSTNLSWHVVLAPDAAWLAQYQPVSFDWADEGASPYVSCWADEGGDGCTFAIVTGRDLRVVTVFGSRDESTVRALGGLLSDE